MPAPHRSNIADGDWLRSVAIAIVTGIFINELTKRWGNGKAAQRKAGKVVPSMMPEGLPAFPANWEPYQNPTSTIVGKRAAELLFQLWGQGEGSTVTEQTPGLNGQWVTYQAQIHHEGSATKKGVGAWRLKAVVHGAVA